MNRSKTSSPDLEKDGFLNAAAAAVTNAVDHDDGERSHANGFSSPMRPTLQASASTLGQRVLRSLLPSFLSSRTPNFDLKPAALHSSTLYLDGLRGYASICVLNSHVVTAFTNAPQMDWGWGKDQYLTPTSLPGVRLLFSGPGMVTLFFLVSGFSCCLKPLEAMASNDPNNQSRALKNLSSSLMRRWFRLYLPVLCCTFMVSLFVYFGGFHLMDFYMTDDNLLHKPEKYVGQQFSLFEQLKFWYDDMYELLNIWHIWPNGQPGTGYYGPFTNPHMWFITVEFKASLILYCSLLALAIARPAQRFFALVLFACYMFLCGKDEILPYFFGACLAQVKLTIDAQRSPSANEAFEKTATGSIPDFLRPLIYANDRGVSRLIWTVLLVTSVWLMSTPAWSYSGPSYYLFTLVVPSTFVRQQTLMQLLGVAGLLLCLMTSTPESKVRRFLTSRTALYLGRISFAVYIVHGPVLLAIGYAVPIALWRVIGVGPVAFFIGLAAAEVVTIALSVWIADVFQRQIETRCVRFTRRVETWMTGER